MIRKNLNQETTALHINLIIPRSFLRTVKIKPVSFYMIRNLLHETKVIGVTKHLK